MKEQTFNKWFNIFLVVGMAICLVVSCVSNLREPDARIALILITSISAMMGVLSVVMAAGANVLTFIFGVAEILIYAYVLWDQKMWMLLMLHVFYMLPMQFIGIKQWKKRGASSGSEPKLKARNLKGKQWLWTILAFVGVWALVMGLRWLFDTYITKEPILNFTDMALDCTMTAANIVALVLMTLAFTDQWYLWVLVNISSIVTWGVRLQEGGPESSYVIAQFFKYVFFLLNALNAIRIWLKLSKNQSPAVADGESLQK